jgi:hypothetical protein
MAEYKMMDEIVCPCTKCKLELNHRIVRLDKGKPKRVLCLTCKAEHIYRKTLPVKAAGTKTRKPRVSSNKGEQEAEWRATLEKAEKNPKPYAMDKPFVLNDHVQHKLFGRGLVVNLIYPDKVDVFFQDGLKTMKCGPLA